MDLGLIAVQIIRERDLNLAVEIVLRVAGDIVGTITTSGEPDRIDHETSAEAIRRYLSLPRST